MQSADLDRKRAFVLMRFLLSSVPGIQKRLQPLVELPAHRRVQEGRHGVPWICRPHRVRAQHLSRVDLVYFWNIAVFEQIAVSLSPSGKHNIMCFISE